MNSKYNRNKSLILAILFHVCAVSIIFGLDFVNTDAHAQGGGKNANQAAAPVTEPTEEESKQARDDFRKKIEKELDDVEAEIETLKAEASKATKDAKKEVTDRLAKLEERKNAVEKQLDEAKESSGRAWTKMKSGLSKAMTELKTAYSEAKTEFDKKTEKKK